MDTRKGLLDLMGMLEAEGLKITQCLVSQELGKRMVEGKKALDEIDYKNLPSDFSFDDLDDEFYQFIPVDKFGTEYVKEKPDNLIGAMFGIDIYIKKSSQR
ncbi:hypothetical protein LCGC14_0883510 [marine sediment metagenome]|uniref:Uncharacterized protein n=1 Tax=marine sediment metagenome TaxID=412755 RepID=A0A0F9PLV2_9ZZZZ